jgi:hypothetical protein
MLSQIGVPSNYIAAADVRPVVWSAFNETFGIMKKLGATVKLETNFAALDAFLTSSAEVCRRKSQSFTDHSAANHALSGRCA